MVAVVTASVMAGYLVGAGSAVAAAPTYSYVPGPFVYTNGGGDTYEGGYPVGVAIDVGTHDAYVTNEQSNSVTVFNNAGGGIYPVSTFSVGDGPDAVAVDPDTHTAYVTNNQDGTVSVSDGTSYTVTDTLPVGNSPDGVTVDASTHTVYVINAGDNTVTVINDDGLGGHVVTGTLPVGNDPSGIAVDASTHTVYVTNAGDNTVTVINDNGHGVYTVTHDIPVGNDPDAIAVDPDTHTAYVTNNQDGTVSVIDEASNTVTHDIPVGNHPRAIAVDASTHTAWISNDQTQGVSVIDEASNTVTDTVENINLDYPYGIAVDPGTRTAYVSYPEDGAVGVFSQSTNQQITFTSTPPANPGVGDSYTVTATGGGSGEPVTFGTGSSACTVTTGGTVSFVHVGDCVITADQAGTPGYYHTANGYDPAPTAAQTVSAIGKGTQAITFTSTPPNPASVGGSYTVTASGGGSGTPVTFGTSSSACTVTTGGTVSFVHRGTCVITAGQAGTTDYNPAPNAAQTANVSGKGTQTITFTSTPPNPALVGGNYLVTATGGGSGAPVTFGVAAAAKPYCRITSTGAVTFTKAGTCSITAAQAGTADYNPATATQQITVTRRPQTITFTSTPPGNAKVGGTYTVTATGGVSGNAVVFSADPAAATCSVTKAGLVAFKKAGSCTIYAKQTGNVGYAPAPTAHQTLLVTN